MIILGVETTAHTFGVGIITSEGKILANQKDSYTSKDIGMIPGEIAQHHTRVSEQVLQAAFKEAKLSWDDIDFIAYSAGPGIDPVLWAGYHKAKEWGERHNKKLVGINHCAAHLSIGKMYNSLKDPLYLYVSGVNTQIIVQEQGKYFILGETLDTALGNTLDKFGRIIGLGFPAGPKIEQLAKKGEYLELPYAVKGMDFSFSGILTKAKQLWTKKPTFREVSKGKTIPLPRETTKDERIQGMLKSRDKKLDRKITKEDLCFSIQETCFAALAEATERALAHTGKKELLLVGGVGANQRFCEMLDLMCQERGATFYKVPMDLAVDQGVMIAWEGYVRRNQFGDSQVKTHWRTDQV